MLFFFKIVYVLILKYIARGLLMLDRILSMMAVTDKIEFSWNIYILKYWLPHYFSKTSYL